MERVLGGAGQTNSQMGELMTLVMSNVDPSNRGKVVDVIRNQIKKAQENGAK